MVASSLRAPNGCFVVGLGGRCCTDGYSKANSFPVCYVWKKMTNNDDQPLRLRRFRTEDAAVVAGWMRSSEDAVAFAGDDAPWPYRPADLVAASAVAGRRAFTVTDGGDGAAVLGHVALVVVSATAGRLARVVLAPHLRGRGRSGALLGLAVREAAAVGLRELSLFVVPSNEAALRAYAAAGFQPAPPDPGHPTYLRMVRQVG
jgi:GNAT superfamily N-acetyltransferase